MTVLWGIFNTVSLPGKVHTFTSLLLSATTLYDGYISQIQYLWWLDGSGYSCWSIKTFHTPKWLQILPGWVLSVGGDLAELAEYITTSNPSWDKLLSTQCKLHLLINNIQWYSNSIAMCRTCRASLFSSASSCTCLISSTAKPTC